MFTKQIKYHSEGTTIWTLMQNILFTTKDKIYKKYGVRVVSNPLHHHWGFPHPVCIYLVCFWQLMDDIHCIFILWFIYIIIRCHKEFWWKFRPYSPSQWLPSSPLRISPPSLYISCLLLTTNGRERSVSLTSTEPSCVQKECIFLSTRKVFNLFNRSYQQCRENTDWYWLISSWYL
jgi:hypothetical protein